MSVQEEELRILQTVKGADALTDLQKKMDGVNRETERLQQKYATSLKLEADEEAQVKKLAAAKQQLTTQISALEQGLDKSTAKTGGMNNAIRSLGYGVSDVFANNGPIGQKIGGFANNVGGLVTGIAQSMGKLGPQAIVVAAGLEIATTAVGALLTAFKINSVEDFFNLFTGKVKNAEHDIAGLKTRIEELTSKPHLIPVEVLELQAARNEVERIESALKAVEALRKTQEYYEKQSGAAVSSIFAEAKDESGAHIGADETYNRLKRVLVNQLQAQVDEGAKNEQAPIRARIEELQKKLDEAPDEFPDRDTVVEISEQRRKLAESIKRQNDAQTAITKGTVDAAGKETPARADIAFGDLVKAAQEGQGAKQAAGREGLAKLAEQAGLKGVAGGIRAASPEDILESEQVEEQLENGNERAKQARLRKKHNDEVEQQRKRNSNAALDKELADAVSQTDRESDDQKATARDDLIKGVDKGTVKARMKAAIRAELDRADEIRKEIRDAVAEEVSQKFLSGIGKREIDKARATGDTKQNREQKAAESKAKTAAEPEAHIIEGAFGDQIKAAIEQAMLNGFTLQQAKGMGQEDLIARGFGSTAAHLAMEKLGTDAATAFLKAMNQGGGGGSGAPGVPPQGPRRALRNVLPPGLQNLPETPVKKTPKQQREDRIAGAQARNAANRLSRQIGIEKARDRHRRKPPTPDLKPGAHQLGGPGVPRSPALTQAIAAADRAQQERQARTQAGMDRAQAPFKPGVMRNAPPKVVQPDPTIPMLNTVLNGVQATQQATAQNTQAIRTLMARAQQADKNGRKLMSASNTSQNMGTS